MIMQCNSYCERTARTRSLILLLFLTVCGINKVIIIIIIIIIIIFIIIIFFLPSVPSFPRAKNLC